MTPTANIHVMIARLVVTLLVVSGISAQFAACAQGQDSASTIVFTNMHIAVIARSNSTSEVSLSSVVTNNGTGPIASFPVRFELRNLYLLEAQVDGVAALTDVLQADTYTLVTVTPAQAIQSTVSVPLSIRFVTPYLQEGIGPSPDGLTYVYHLIYYLKTLNEVQNLTLSIALPPHAILQHDVAAPLFPQPTTNHTDGERLVFVWSITGLQPGQEIAYIVKYQLPLTVAPSASSALLTAAIVLGSVLIGALLVVSLERVPRLLARSKRMGPPQLAGVSNHEAQVIQFITQRGGSCTQKEIYDELDLSQSMVSTILSTLEQRGTIRRFKDGRENMVHIME